MSHRFFGDVLVSVLERRKVQYASDFLDDVQLVTSNFFFHLLVDTKRFAPETFKLLKTWTAWDSES